MGDLQVTVVSGKSLCAADRGNKSDPYVKFYLSTQKEHLYKTDTVKKTLNPEWNETFECSVSSRIDDVFRVEVYDWDQVGEDDHLGTAVIPLASLVPMTSVSIDVPLDGPRGGNGKSGTIKLQLLFKPSFVTRTRRGTTARASTIATGVVSSPAKVVGAGFTGIKKTGSLIGGKFANRRSSSAEAGVPEISLSRDGAAIVQGRDSETLESTPALSALVHDRTTVVTPHEQKADAQYASKDSAGASAASHGREHFRTGDSTNEGMLHIRIINGEGFPMERKTLIKVRSRSGQIAGKAEVSKGANPSINADLRCPISSDDELEFVLLEQHTFGSDKEIAQVVLPLSPEVLHGEPFRCQFDNSMTVITIELRLSQTDATSMKSRRGLKLNSPFRKSSSQR